MILAALEVSKVDDNTLVTGIRVLLSREMLILFFLCKNVALPCSLCLDGSYLSDGCILVPSHKFRVQCDLHVSIYILYKQKYNDKP